MLKPYGLPFRLVNQIYSRIVCVYLSEAEDMASNSGVSKSWVVIESKKFNTLHFIMLSDLLPYRNDD